MENNYFEFDKFFEFKNDFFNSKKYWIIYLILIGFYFLFNYNIWEYFNLKQVGCIILISFLGVFYISYFYGHNVDLELYKIAFVIIMGFGIIFSFLSPVMFIPDEVEHFVRAEMISRGEISPEYFETPYVYGGIQQKGYYLTIQSTLDLIKYNKNTTTTTGYDNMLVLNVFDTDIIDMPINSTLVKYHSAFTQNPFYGYLPQAVGILIAKLLNLNAIWMMWLGRFCNLLFYAFLVSWAIKKTPILKIPLLIIVCIPLVLFQVSSLSIDAMINGFGILSISYFFKMSYSNDLTYVNVVKFSIIVLLLGFCKLTYFSFIFLLIFVPRSNFKEKNHYYLNFLSILILSIIALLWSKYYANPNYLNSWRFVYFNLNNIYPMKKLIYVLSNKLDTFMFFFGQFFDSLFTLVLSFEFNEIFLLFLVLMSLIYPKPNFNLKLKLGALFVFLLCYLGNLFIIFLTWSPFNELIFSGFHSRYVFSTLALIPFIIGINRFNCNKFKLDLYLFVILISFISFNLFQFIMIY